MTRTTTFIDSHTDSAESKFNKWTEENDVEVISHSFYVNPAGNKIISVIYKDKTKNILNEYVSGGKVGC